MPKKGTSTKSSAAPAIPSGKPSALLDTRVIYCGDNLEQLAKLPERCIDLIYIDPLVSARGRNYEVFRGETKEKRALEDCDETLKPTSITCAPAARSLPASSKAPVMSEADRGSQMGFDS